MIVKIAQEKGWVIYDNFEKVRYEHITLEQAKEFDADAFWLNPNKKSDHCILIIANKRSSEYHLKKIGLSFSIVADSVIYLCNDEGKTIERIN